MICGRKGGNFRFHDLDKLFNMIVIIRRCVSCYERRCQGEIIQILSGNTMEILIFIESSADILADPDREIAPHFITRTLELLS